MTEAEWHTCEDAEAVLNELGRTASIRKLRLFMCACCRRVWEHIQEPYCREAVEVTERYLNQEATAEEFARAADNVDWAWSRQESDGCVLAEEAAMHPTVADPFERTTSCIHCILDCCRYSSCGDQFTTPESESAAQAALLHDLFGNPFRPTTFAPVWRTDTVMMLAAQMYETKDFSTMPVLADALQDAGCDSDDILNHCRTSGTHVRGCWVVDLVLGKS